MRPIDIVLLVPVRVCVHDRVTRFATRRRYSRDLRREGCVRDEVGGHSDVPAALCCAGPRSAQHGTPRPSFLRRDARMERERKRERERKGEGEGEGRRGKTANYDGGRKSDGGDREGI